MILITRLAPLLFFAVCLAPARADVYDKPLSIKKVKLPRSDPRSLNAEHELICYNYSGYTVKQDKDSDVKGAVLSIVEGVTLPCRAAKEPGEYVLPFDIWSCYYAGAKSGYVFIDSDDGINSGMGFMVLRVADKKKLFDDVYQGKIESIAMNDGAPLLRYKRAYAGNCSVLTDGAACAKSIAYETGVSRDLLALCSKGYRAAYEWAARVLCKNEGRNNAAYIAKESNNGDKRRWNATPSVIVYEVEVDLRETIVPD